MIVENIIIALLIPTILRVYHLSDLTAQTTEQILLFHAVAVVTIWPLSFSLPCTLRAAGDVQYTMYMSIFSMWIFRIAFSYVLGKYMGLGVFGIWAVSYTHLDVYKRQEILTAVISSQVISNVPAALLLSGFTDQWSELIIGTNLGGLGTMIASLSLIHI